VLIDNAAAGEDKAAPKASKKGNGDKAAAKDKAPKGEYAIMAKTLGMDEAQTAKLNEAVENCNKALKAWDEGDNGKKLQEFQAALKQAREAKDKDKVKSISEQAKPLQKERGDLEAAQRALIMNVLTDEQKAKWAGFTLYRSVIGKYKRLNLTEDQDKQVRDICAAGAKGMPDASDKQARGEAMKKLATEIVDKVLTAAQKEELKKEPVKPAKEPGVKQPKAEGDAKEVKK
jgi:hypothetical protein